MKNISRDDLIDLLDARNKLCDFCEVNECERCIVTRLIDDAYVESRLMDDDGWDDDEEEQDDE